MKIINPEEYFEHLDISESAYFLEIDHSGKRQKYELFKVVDLYWECIFSTDVKDELKIWMDLNGMKMIGKKIIVGYVSDKLYINFESFELNKD